MNPQSAGPNPQSAALAAWEIATVVLSVLVAEWVVLSVAGGSVPALAFVILTSVAFMLLSHRARGETARDVGWRLDNFGRASRLIAPPMILTTVLLVAAGLYTSKLDFTRWRGEDSLPRVLLLGVLWGFLQQYALQGFINRRAQIIWGRGPFSVLAVALTFALLHLPNPWLMLATFAGGLVWARAYQKEPNLLALGLSHGLMTWVLISAFPSAALHNLRVGYKFFG
ncbi:MAG TPA: CPBP family intramembrane glutamic endopeptidase [Pyrinomonadaceae bacterium]|jgi:membrane protease YdiL (CAAX protease family)|nr:CPBP family intramembrane glutamic endopeptidase [Pyrinomonadaceae bacterium]